MTELKPCPFCGGTNVIVEEDDRLLNGHKFWYIVHGMYQEKCPLVNMFNAWYSSAKFTTREKAIEAWNRRVDNG